MDPKLLHELLKFVGLHPFLALALALIVGVVALNVLSYLRGRISIRTLHKRPHEIGVYLAGAMTLISFINHFLEGACR